MELKNIAGETVREKQVDEITKGLNKNWLVQTVQDKFGYNTPTELIDITTKLLLSEGQNLTSDLWEIKVAFKTETAAHKIVSLVAKISRDTGTGNGGTDDISSNRTEIIVYQRFLAELEGLMAECDDTRGKLWPDLIGFVNYTTILLENLQVRNFNIIDHTDWMHTEHAILTMREIAKFHAMSKVLLQRGTIEDEFVDKYAIAKTSVLTEKFFKGGLHVLANCMIAKKGEWSKVPFGQECGRRIQNTIPSVNDRMDSIYVEHEKRFDVLNHGDLKSSNILFRNEKNSDAPVALKFVDFQLSHVNSFIWDLTLFLFSTVKPTVRRNHLRQLLTTYSQSYSDNLKSYKCEENELREEDIYNEYNRVLFAGFALISVLAPVNHGFGENVLDLNKMFTHPPEDVFKEALFTSEMYVTEVATDFKYFMDIGLI